MRNNKNNRDKEDNKHYQYFHDLHHPYHLLQLLHFLHHHIATSSHRRNRSLTVAGPSITQLIVHPTPRTREELVQYIIPIIKEEEQIISIIF